MELVAFAKEVIQNVAEQAASYRLGQTALRQMDRALWVVEKCARWAVPPPLDQDERPQPELVRPLPWVLFLAMLVALRVTREAVSLVNLVLGKPPLRSADVVMYIQSKRRYLRTLKYQGTRITRARSAPPPEPWYSGLQALFEFTMCFRRSQHYGNNNTTRVSNNDEVLVVKRSKRTRETGAVASTSESTMERLIEKMMVDLDADSDDDSSFTLTNAASPNSLRSENSDSEENTVENPNDTFKSANSISSSVDASNDMSSIKGDVACSTPEKKNEIDNDDNPQVAEKSEVENGTENESTQISKAALSEPNIEINSSADVSRTELQTKQPANTEGSPKKETQNFLDRERCSPQKHQSKHSKFANGRAMSVPNKKRGMANQRRDTDVPLMRVPPSDNAL